MLPVVSRLDDGALVGAVRVGDVSHDGHVELNGARGSRVWQVVGREVLRRMRRILVRTELGKKQRLTRSTHSFGSYQRQDL